MRQFNDLISRKRVEIETKFDLPSIFFDIKLLLNSILLKFFGDLLEILLKVISLLRHEYALQNLINFSEMSHLDHPIGLVNDQILEVIELKRFLIQQFMQSTRCSDDDLRTMLGQDPQLFFFGDSSNDAANCQL